MSDTWFYKWVENHKDDLADDAIGLAFDTVTLLEAGEVEEAKIAAGRCVQAQEVRDSWRYKTKHLEVDHLRERYKK